MHFSVSNGGHNIGNIGTGERLVELNQLMNVFIV